jgi:hypothetical protein
MATSNQKPVKTVTINYVDPAPGQSTQLEIINDPGGNVGEVQFNAKGGLFGGSNAFVWNNTTSNLGVRGNLSVTGNIYGNISASSTNLKIKGGVSGDVLVTDGTGNLTWTSLQDAGGYGNSEVANYLPTFEGELSAGNADLGNAVTANFFIGNGSLLTGLPAGYANSNVANYLPTYTGNLTAGNANLGNSVTANYFIGNFYGTANLATFATTANGVAAANVSGLGNIATLNLDGSNNNVLYGNGVFASIPSGANTGNVTFNDISIIGTSNLKLQPDSANSSAYLDIYLTSGPDIHIAGNGETVILGTDDYANVAVNIDGNVSIQAGDANGTQTWNFGTDGNTTIPGFITSNNTITIDNQNSGNSADINIYSADNILLQGKDMPVGADAEGGDINIYGGDGSPDDGTDTSGTGGDIHISAGVGGYANTFSASGGGTMRLRGGGGGDASVTSQAGNGGYIEITGGYAGSDGGNTALGAAGGYVEIIAGGSTQEGINGASVTISSGVSGPNALAGSVEISTPISANGPGGTWTFDGNGILTLPDGAIIDTIGNNFEVRAIENVNFEANAVVNIYTDGSNNAYQWQFDADGNLTLPRGGMIYETNIPGGVLSGNTIVLKPQGGTNADQQLLVYPTAIGSDFNHLHMTSGNLYNTELFLGNDDFYIKLANTGNVVINSNDGTGNTAQWTFGSNSNFTLPGGSLIDDTPTGVQISGAGQTAVNRFYTKVSNTLYEAVDAGVTYRLIDQGIWSLDVVGESNPRYTSADLITWADTGGGLPAPTGTIINGSANITVSGNTWTFNSNGNLTVPGSLINDTSMVLSAPAVFNICTISNAGSGYNTGSSLKATTGGSGTGMTVGIGYGLSDQLTSVTVVDPGTGYVNGDVITVSEGTGGTFVITKYNQLANQTNNNTVQTNLTFADNTLTLPTYGEIIAPGNITANNIGNITPINLDGSSSNVLYGNGVFAPQTGGGGGGAAISNGTSYANVVSSDGNVVIGVDSNNMTWTFATDRKIYGKLDEDVTIVAVDDGNDSSVRQQIVDDNLDALSQTRLEPGDFYIQFDLDSGGNSWRFDNGSLRPPEGGAFEQFDGNIRMYAMNAGSNPVASLQSVSNQNDPNIFTTIDATTTGANISVYNGGSNGGTGYTWQFANDGSLTLPANTFAINYANGTQVSLGSGSSSNISNGNSNVNIATANGNVTISSAGNTTMTITGTGANITGTLNVTGNISTSTGTFVGNGAGLTNVTVNAAGNIQGTSSNVSLVAGSYTMTFDNTGNLTLPGNTFSLNYANNTPVNVVTKFESSWTVPVGNSTQSFTVGANETYYMWVDCNIPNGILTWNATATVTNTNVPVVGAQYAWVYNGGGTPIDFTSIPNQFIGTSNTIVRSNVAPSSTTNRFDFGINNTSGGNVTVRYGWIVIS